MRLITALAVSLAVHLVVASLPAGEGLHQPRLPAGTNPLRGRPAPLRVNLTPYLQTAPLTVVGTTRQAATAPISAPLIAEDAGTSGAHEESATVDVADTGPPDFGLPVPRYYSQREVSRRATLAEEIDPATEELQALPGSGMLVLALWLSEAGQVERIEVEAGSAPTALQEIIVKQFQAARFTPAEVEGRPVKSRLRIEVTVRPRRP